VAKYALLTVVVAAVPAFASDTSVTQKNKTFSSASIVLHVGDTLRFMNEDTVTHNITVKPLGGDDDADDLGLQKPGQAVSHHFTQPGLYRVVCSIHPHMRLDIKVQ